MLTIADLHNEQELSSYEMGKVAGGCGNWPAERALIGWAQVMEHAGFDGAAGVLRDGADTISGDCRTGWSSPSDGGDDGAP